MLVENEEHNMFTTKLMGRTIAIVTVFVLALSGVQPAFAAAPLNDNFTDAELIGSLPFSGSVDNTEATIEPDEPQPYYSSSRTVWYSFTPTNNAVLIADMANSGFGDTVINVYQAQAPGFGGLYFLGYTVYGGSVTFSVQAGITYYLQAGSISSSGGELHINLQVIPPPLNDNFANATVIPSPLPFDDSVDTIAASFEANEQYPSCGQNTGDKTAWYAFTPAESVSVSASISGSAFYPILAIYTGDSLANLTMAGCTNGWSVLTFQATAGTTYYIQEAGYFGQGGLMQLHLAVTPPPTAFICFGPSDPSVFDNMQFSDCSSDPGQIGFQSFSWNFGDGTTLTTQNCCVNHQYAADGAYTVQHAVTTYDGRTASTSQVVHVLTKDIAITTFSVPQTARANQTKTINVNIQNKRYADYVQVTLYKGLPGCCEQYQLIGTLTIYVPAKAKQATTFKFTYTFTSDDAKIGKVTFKAVANIVNSNDVLPADNTSIATTLVSK
jgi:PKD domain-containing protein